MYYTIDQLVLLKNDKELSIQPKDYKDGNKVIGDEIIAFMTGHLGDMSWKLGATTGYGPHSFMLTMFPTIENLRFWVQVQRMKGQIRVGCSGDLEVVIKGERLTPPPRCRCHCAPTGESDSAEKPRGVYSQSHKEVVQMRQVQIRQNSFNEILPLLSIANEIFHKHEIEIVDGTMCSQSIEVCVEGDIFSILDDFEWETGNQYENYHEIIVFVDEDVEIRYFIDKDEFIILRRENDRRVDTQTATQV